MLKERLAHIVFVLGTAIRERVDDLSDIVNNKVGRSFTVQHVSVNLIYNIL